MPGLVAGTLVSEDLTSIAAGLLVRDGKLSAFSAVAACAAGVYIGDLSLWVAGRLLGRHLLRVAWIARRLDAAALEELGERLDTRLVPIVLGSRFLPGSRLPMFVAAGIFGRRPFAFAAWSLVAVLLWTPLLVLITAWLGPSLTAPLVGELGYVFRCLALSGALTMALRLVAGRLPQSTFQVGSAPRPARYRSSW
jgi:membrane protein DedA with SNARE-associated domain